MAEQKYKHERLKWSEMNKWKKMFVIGITIDLISTLLLMLHLYLFGYNITIVLFLLLIALFAGMATYIVGLFKPWEDGIQELK